MVQIHKLNHSCSTWACLKLGLWISCLFPTLTNQKIGVFFWRGEMCFDDLPETTHIAMDVARSISFNLACIILYLHFAQEGRCSFCVQQQHLGAKHHVNADVFHFQEMLLLWGRPQEYHLGISTLIYMSGIGCTLMINKHADRLSSFSSNQPIGWNQIRNWGFTHQWICFFQTTWVPTWPRARQVSIDGWMHQDLREILQARGSQGPCFDWSLGFVLDGLTFKNRGQLGL